MNRPNAQAPAAVVMIRPHHFTPNVQTASDNRFQQPVDGVDATTLATTAYDEASEVAGILAERGVDAHVFEDDVPGTPDSVFPNNWFSTHAGGHVALYPMYAANRRRERRYDVIEMLKRDYRVQDVIDYSGLEADGLFLEGTGAMVLDHLDRVAYAVRSKRTDPVMLERFCTHFNFEPVVFDARDGNGVPVYHTNVLMCIGTDFAMIGLDMIEDPARRAGIEHRLVASGRDVIALGEEQIAEFAGNAIELQGATGRILALSMRAMESLTREQRALIGRSAALVPLEIPTIELAGGSVRCMLAGIHLAKR